MTRSWYTRSYAKPNFIQTPRVKAVTRERAWMAAHPYAFGDYDHVAAHLQKRARERSHARSSAKARELHYLQWNRPNFGSFKLNKYRRSMTKYPKKR